MSFFKPKKWLKGLGNTLQFWDYDKVTKGIKQQWTSGDFDPLGRFLAGSFFPDSSKYQGVSSASGWTEIPGTSFRRYY